MNTQLTKTILAAVITVMAILSAGAQVQKGVVKVVSHSTKTANNLSGVYIIVDKHNDGLSDANGEFVIDMHGVAEGEGFVIKDVKKNGYALLNPGDLREYPFSSSIELSLYMYSIREKLREQDVLYKRWSKTLETKIGHLKDSLMTELEEARIENRHFEEQLNAIEDYYAKSQNLLKTLSEHYAMLNYDDMSAWEIQLSELVESGRFEAADSLINLRGLENIINDAKHAQQNARTAQTIYENAQKEAERKTKEAIQALFAKHAAAITQADRIHAVDYMLEIVALDSTDISYLRLLADDLSMIGRYDEALMYIHKAQEEARRIGSTSMLAMTFADEGNLDLAKNKDAIRKIEITTQACNLYSDTQNAYIGYEDSVALFLVFSELASALSIYGDFTRANTCMYTAINFIPEIIRNSEIDESKLTFSNNSFAYSYANNLASRGAADELLEFLNMFPKDSLPSEMDMFYAIAYFSKSGKSKDAIRHAHRFLEHAQREAKDNKDVLFVAYITLSRAYLIDGNYNVASQYLDSTRIVYQSNSIQNPIFYISILNQVGVNYYNNTHEYDKAIPIFKEAVHVMDSTETYNPLIRSLLLYNIAQNYAELNELDSALQYHNQALEIRLEQSTQDDAETYSHTLAESYAGIAYTYGKMEDYIKASYYYYKALEIQIQITEDDLESWKNYLSNAHYYLQKAKDDPNISKTKEFQQYYAKYTERCMHMLYANDSDMCILLEVNGKPCGDDFIFFKKLTTENKTALVYTYDDQFIELSTNELTRYNLLYFPVGKKEKQTILKAYKKYKKKH